MLFIVVVSTTMAVSSIYGITEELAIIHVPNKRASISIDTLAPKERSSKDRKLIMKFALKITYFLSIIITLIEDIQVLSVWLDIPKAKARTVVMGC